MSSFTIDWYESASRDINDLYVELLDRDSDIVGASTWLYHMREENHDLAWVRARIMESDEYVALHSQPLPSSTALPPSKSRSSICGVRLTFQGLTVDTAQYGQLPWFDAALFSLTPDDRARVYAAKRSVGDTHAIIGYDKQTGSIYDEPNNPYQQMNGAAFELHAEEFLAAVREVLVEGFTPMIFMGGDDGERGYVVAHEQLPRLISLLRTGERDYTADVLIVPGWDGVFYGWTPEHIVQFGKDFRALAPNGHLAIEHQPGRIPVGNGPSDWQYGADRMEHYDVLLSEFANWPERGDQIWQVAARTLGPAYRRPSDQPSIDDPRPPFYLSTGNARGPYFAVAFEFAEYPWVRSRISPSDVDQARRYFKSLGYIYTG